MWRLYILSVPHDLHWRIHSNISFPPFSRFPFYVSYLVMIFSTSPVPYGRFIIHLFPRVHGVTEVPLSSPSLSTLSFHRSDRCFDSFAFSPLKEETQYLFVCHFCLFPTPIRSNFCFIPFPNFGRWKPHWPCPPTFLSSRRTFYWHQATSALTPRISLVPWFCSPVPLRPLLLPACLIPFPFLVSQTTLLPLGVLSPFLIIVQADHTLPRPFFLRHHPIFFPALVLAPGSPWPGW